MKGAYMCYFALCTIRFLSVGAQCFSTLKVPYVPSLAIRQRWVQGIYVSLSGLKAGWVWTVRSLSLSLGQCHLCWLQMVLLKARLHYATRPTNLFSLQKELCLTSHSLTRSIFLTLTIHLGVPQCRYYGHFIRVVQNSFMYGTRTVCGCLDVMAPCTDSNLELHSKSRYEACTSTYTYHTVYI